METVVASVMRLPEGDYVTPYAMGADLHEAAGQCARLSSVTHAARVDTAILFLHGEDDQRCPAGQSEEMFAGLIRTGCGNLMMVIYPAARTAWPAAASRRTGSTTTGASRTGLRRTSDATLTAALAAWRPSSPPACTR